jgi:hypothetical protein
VVLVALVLVLTAPERVALALALVLALVLAALALLAPPLARPPVPKLAPKLAPKLLAHQAPPLARLPVLNSNRSSSGCGGELTSVACLAASGSIHSTKNFLTLF